VVGPARQAARRAAGAQGSGRVPLGTPQLGQFDGQPNRWLALVRRPHGQAAMKLGAGRRPAATRRAPVTASPHALGTVAGPNTSDSARLGQAQGRQSLRPDCQSASNQPPPGRYGPARVRSPRRAR